MIRRLAGHVTAAATLLFFLSSPFARVEPHIDLCVVHDDDLAAVSPAMAVVVGLGAASLASWRDWPPE